jgi:hypothetical protein
MLKKHKTTKTDTTQKINHQKATHTVHICALLEASLEPNNI